MSNWLAGDGDNQVLTPPEAPGVGQGALRAARHKVRIDDRYPSLPHPKVCAERHLGQGGEIST
jgi:hypothetical protein